jgi:tetratricopeptide (TPR) repeat protein
VWPYNSVVQRIKKTMNYSSRLSAFCDKVIEACWLAALVVVPLFFDVYSSRVFEPDKITLLRSLALVMVGAWMIKWLEERRNPAFRDRPDRVTWRTPLILPTLLFAGIYVIASLFSLVPHVSILGSYQRLQGLYSMLSYMVVFWMIVMNLRRRAQLDRIVTAVVITSLPIAFYGLLQHGDGVRSIDPLPWGGDVTTRVASNMGNPIFVAAYLIMAFFLTLGRIIESFRVILTEKESRLSDILRASTYVFVAALQLITFGFADSRGPLLGWLPGMFIFGLVGLLLLRVSLHSDAARAGVDDTRQDDQPAAVRYPITSLDVFKALLMALVSLVGAGLGAGLVYALFPPPQFKITTVVMGALLGGLLPLLIAVGIRRTAARWIWASWILFSVVGAIGLFLVNFSDHPQMNEWRQSGTFGRLSSLLESEGGTGKVRSLIWEGAVKLIQSTEPQQFPDGSQDTLIFLRPIIGYGPESMYVAYNRFYPPDLAHYEARNASPDRSHNEIWDSLVNTGISGFVLEQFLFLGIFFYALRFIGWIPNRRAALALIGLMVGGGLLGALALGAAISVNFMGAGWPGGVTAGLVLYVIAFALFHFQISPRVYALFAGVLIVLVDLAIFGATFTSTNRMLELAAATLGSLALFTVMYFVGRYVFNPTAGQPIEISGHIFMIVALFGAILAHYLEISLAGIAIASTRTYFWTYAGMLVVLGLHWVPADVESEQPVKAPVSSGDSKPSAAPAAPLNKKKSRRTQSLMPSKPAKRDGYSNWSAWLGPVAAMALVSALIMGTLGYEFINSAPQAGPVNNATVLILNSLTRLPYQNNQSSYGALLMFSVTFIFGGLLSLTELRRRGVIPAKDVWAATGVYYGLVLGVTLVFYLLAANHLLSLSSLVQPTQVSTLQQYALRSKELVALAETISNTLTLYYVFVAIIIFSLAGVLLLEVRERLARWTTGWGLVAAVPIGLVALIGITSTNLNPIRADIIYKQAEAMRNNGQLDVAIAHYKRARELNPAEDFYLLWLGAAFLDKATNAPDSPSIFSSVPSIDSLLKLDFERTYGLNRADTLTAAKVVLESARNLNPLNTDHSANLGRLHRRWADLYGGDPAARQQELDTAAEFYREATSLSPNNAQLWNEWATVVLSQSDLARQLNDSARADALLAEAQAKADHSLELDQKYDQTYLLLGQLARLKGDLAAAQQNFDLAQQLNAGSLDAAGSSLDILLQQQNYTEAEKLAISFLQKNPDSLPMLRTLARNVYYPQNRLEEAIPLMQRVIELSPTDPNSWEDRRALAILLAQSGRLEEALQAAQAALALTPQDQKSQIEGLIQQLQTQLDVAPVPSDTLPVVVPAPQP